jgi:DNA-binding Lrp family transcriptional regulator
MGRFSYEKKVSVFHKIYEQVHKDSFVTKCDTAKKIGVSRKTVGDYLRKMYRSSIIIGPVISLNPAKNYHQYAYFLQCENPFLTYINLGKDPNILFRSVEFGPWNLFIISDKKMDFSSLKGVKQNFFQGVKGTTHFSTVVSVDWDVCLERMYNAVAPPGEKSTLYQKGPTIFWSQEGWKLYHVFRKNLRIPKCPVLEKYGIRYSYFLKWLHTLPEYTCVQPGFYPHEYDSYFSIDFLFESEYHTQLKDILGMLPSTGIFFTVGDHLLARLFYLTKKEKDELLKFILELREYKYYTNVFNAITVSGSRENRNGNKNEDKDVIIY